MVTVWQARKVALSMPQAEECEHHNHPDFRVNGKIFATLWPGKSTAVVKLPLADQAALVQMDPDTFSLNAWSYQGATTVNLRHITLAKFRGVVLAAWRNVAPKRLVASSDNPPGIPSTSRAAHTDLGFTYRATAQGVVHISRGGREVVTLRAQAAARFLAKAHGASFDAIQQLCARATGNYKRGNESRTSRYPPTTR